MSDGYSYPLGRYRGRKYELVARFSPSLDDIQRFAVVVFYGSDAEKTEVARIDTAHGFAHFDRLYRRDQPKERVEMNA